MKEWKVFYYNDKEIGAYTIHGTFGDMKLARHQIADEIDKVCIIARWDFAVGRYKEKIKVYFTKVKKEQRFQRLPNNEKYKWR